MTTLTQTAIFSKKVFHSLIIGLAAVIFLIIAFMVSRIVQKSYFPQKALPATVAFGKIPKLDLSDGIKPPSGTTYTIETISGDLPSLEGTAKVFAAHEAEASFGDLERTKIKVSRSGFNKQPIEVANGKAKFVDPEKEDRILTIETASGNLVLESNYLNNPQIITGRLKSPDEALQRAREFLKLFDISERDFPKDKVETIKYKADSGVLREVQALSSANLLQFNWQRADLDKLPVATPRVNQANVWVLVSEKEVVAASVSLFGIKKHQFATYPLKGTLKAFENLKNGKAAFTKEATSQNVPIRDVILGYLETEKFAPFLQPVYFFKSDDGLIAAVAAVDESWNK